MKMTVNRIIYQSNFLRVKKTKSRSLDRFLIQSAKINQIDRFNFHTAYHLSSDQGVPDMDEDELDEVCLMTSTR